MRTREDNPQDWYLLAADRLQSADAIFHSIGVTYSAVELLQEAADRYLNGYVIGRGWKLIKTHDLQRLIEEARRFDSRFERFELIASQLTEQYFRLHYPGGDLTGVTSDYAQLREQLGELINLILSQYPSSSEK
ncbi:MAG: HEPN domain-containing protein [Candidatus Brachytrichaceae bacterium NZ_4S206]|jgi:HEPN domain-containing protein